MSNNQDAQITGFIDFLTQKGILEDPQINDETVRKARKETIQNAYHNTKLLLQKYRSITWVLNCVPDEIAQELHVPLQNIDALAEKLEIQSEIQNRRMDSRLNTAMRTRALIERIHDALMVVRSEPLKGELMYQVIYSTYIDPVTRKHPDLLKHLSITDRTYYRLRKEAISIMSIRLWATPSENVDLWFELLTLIDNL